MESITAPSQLTPAAVAAIDPQWIFVPHWSHWIPDTIWGPWPTVIFHMTDLPYGRGGSPLQNLIQRGHSSTMLTALRCGAGLDAGDVYLKQPLSLHGSAEEIFLRADGLIEQMIELDDESDPIPADPNADREFLRFLFVDAPSRMFAEHVVQATQRALELQAIERESRQKN